MKYLFLLTWVGQFGFSLVFPPCFFLMLALWLRNQYDLGIWAVFTGGILGFLIAIKTACFNWRAMKKAADEISSVKPTPVSFNDHK